jgi:phage head maturation protease
VTVETAPALEIEPVAEPVPGLPAAPPHDANDMATTAFDDADVAVRSLDKREIEARIVPWGVIVDTPIGPEQFLPGAFDHVDPRKVVLTVEHKGAFGPPIGRGVWTENRSDGQYMGFAVSRTLHGDEGLQLAADGVTPHVSIVYHLPTSKGEVQYRSGQRATSWNRVDLREVATTWKPYYPTADVTAVRSVQHEETDVSTATETSEPKAPEPVPAPAPDPEPDQARSLDAAFASFEGRLGQAVTGATQPIVDRLAALEERARSSFVIPGEQPADAGPELGKGHWLQYALRAMSGDRISTQDEQYRALADVITSDNLGVVPDSFSQELIGVIDPSRPFLSSTRKLPTPASGMTMHVPKITQRPIVGIQSDEKGDVQSRETHITDETFNAVTKAGGGDLSLQVLKRSDPSFLDLYLRLLAEAYAMDTEAEAIEALLGDSEVNDGLTLNPAETGLGDAFVTSFDAIRRGPDTIWLSSAAVGAFIDAVSPVTGMPMYSSITADFSVPGGISGTIKGLRPVHVPELGAQGADVIIGPSSGFAWAEDGTYTLQVDVPAKAGRDVALVGILWFAPYYPGAFSVYDLES